MRNDLAMVFPGQGAQSVGMMREFAAVSPAVAERFERASAVLGFDLWKLVQEGPADELNKTMNTQPALLAASVATWDVWCANGGPEPAFMAGHSFGEYTALVCSGALAYEDAVALVADRGRFMQEAVAPGSGAVFAVLGLDAGPLSAICAEAAQGQVVQCANLNAPGQVVLSGDRAAVERAGALAKEKGAKKVIPLAVSVPVHCALMNAAAEKFAPRIAGIAFQTPRIPVIHNVDVEPHPEPAAIRDILVRQLAAGVRWSETIERFAKSGVRAVVECGPGKVLTPLVKRCAGGLATYSLAAPADVTAAIAALENQS